MNKRQEELAIRGLEASFAGLACIKWAEKIDNRSEELVLEMEIAKKSENVQSIISIAAEMALLTKLMDTIGEVSQKSTDEREAIKKELFNGSL